jgi:hypothetical protein
MLGQLLIIKELDNKNNVKLYIYCLAIERILTCEYTPLLRKIDVNTIYLAIEKLGKEGFNVTCADGYIRLCYPIIARMCEDHEVARHLGPNSSGSKDILHTQSGVKPILCIYSLRSESL